MSDSNQSSLTPQQVVNRRLAQLSDEQVQSLRFQYPEIVRDEMLDRVHKTRQSPDDAWNRSQKVMRDYREAVRLREAPEEDPGD